MSDPALNSILDELEDSGHIDDPDALLEAFARWAESSGRPLYPHQRESAEAIFSGAHVIAATPTGSGKSMIALAGHFKALAEGERSYYTAPLKALVSEKFFDLVALFGSDNVGMITGDVSLNADAPIICATAEILANASLREGADLDASLVVMDEFHFYSEPDRGWAWQVPLLRMPRTQMVLMSATLGDVTFFERDLERRTHRPVVTVDSAERPVPLEMEYSKEPMDRLLERLVKQGRYPIYLVHFSQREALSSAQSLLSADLLNREAKERIAQQLRGTDLSTRFGVTLSKLLKAGIGVHHAGMLPRYRRLVERLAQGGLLAVVCGTDTLGVGINVPIRTVVMTSLAKFDGSRERRLNAREFHQIAGRAGRAGFDSVGFVVVMAPQHVIEAERERVNAAGDPKKLKKLSKKSAPDGRVSWDEQTFERLRDAEPQPLVSRMRFSPSMVLSVLQGGSADQLLELARDNHDAPTARNPHLRRLGQIYESLLSAEAITQSEDGSISISEDAPIDFALNQTLSPFVLAGMDLLNPDSETFALDCVSLIEATLEDPRPLLWAQQGEAKGEAVAAMKAQGMDYNERMEALEEVTWPKPLEELLVPAFEIYARANPWVEGAELSPKSVVRMMVENSMTFTELIARYDLAAAEGVVLRYLSDAYRALRQVIPPSLRNDEFNAITNWLGDLVRSVDSSLIDEWESAGQPVTQSMSQTPERAFGSDKDGKVRFSANMHFARNQVRKVAFRVIELMAADQPEQLERLGFAAWNADRFDEVLEDLYTDHDGISIEQEARSNAYAEFGVDLEAAGIDYRLPDRSLVLCQRIVDDEGDLDWAAWFVCDLDASDEAEEPVVDLVKIGRI